MCKAQGFHVFRLRDSKDVNGLNKTKGGRRLAMFPCPADFLVAQPGSMVLTEVKSTQNKTSFPYANIEPHSVLPPVSVLLSGHRIISGFTQLR